MNRDTKSAPTPSDGASLSIEHASMENHIMQINVLFFLHTYICIVGEVYKYNIILNGNLNLTC